MYLAASAEGEMLSMTFAGGNKRTGEVTIHPGINGTAALHSRHFIKFVLILNNMSSVTPSDILPLSP